MGRSLKDLKSDPAWNGKQAMRDQCIDLQSRLDDALRETAEQVHVRTAVQGFGLRAGRSRLEPEAFGVSKARPGEIRPSTEALLECALFERYRPINTAVPTPWRHLVARQVPLYNKRDSEGWGKIDLLGLSEPGAPVIVELKKRSSVDTPLHALLEAACYAVSLRKNWELLADEIRATYGGLTVIADLDVIPLVLLAPEAFWHEWHRWSSTGGGVPADTRDAFARLCAAFAARGMPVSLATVRYPDRWDERTVLRGEDVSTTDVHHVLA